MGGTTGSGLGGWFAARTGWWSALLAIGSTGMVSVSAAVALGRPGFVLGAIGGILIGVLFSRWLALKRHGLDGDALGAIVEVGFGAILLGLVFMWRALQLARHNTPERAIKFFTLSNLYLATLFAALAVDTLVQSL